MSAQGLRLPITYHSLSWESLWCFWEEGMGGFSEFWGKNVNLVEIAEGIMLSGWII